MPDPRKSEGEEILISPNQNHDPRFEEEPHIPIKHAIPFQDNPNTNYKQNQ